MTRVRRRPADQTISPRGFASRIWHDHGLSIVLMALFFGTMGGQTLTGWRVHNEEQRQHQQSPVTLAEYVVTGHFGEATMEN